eukprot:343715-Pleurochrysis_carterae.AAC.1
MTGSALAPLSISLPPRACAGRKLLLYSSATQAKTGTRTCELQSRRVPGVRSESYCTPAQDERE